MSNNDELWTVTEAAAYLTLSKSLLNKRRLTGDGPKFVRLGNSIRYKKADLDAWIDAGLKRSTSEYNSVVTERLRGEILNAAPMIAAAVRGRPPKTRPCEAWDDFAAAALAGLLMAEGALNSQVYSDLRTHEQTAKKAAKIADSLMAERASRFGK